MTASQRLLITAGLALVIWGMVFGFYYAVFIEHQTLDSIGGHLATAFVRAAESNLPAARTEVDAYAAAKYAYVRQVDAHSHWGGLACILILLGIAYRRVGFPESFRVKVAAALVAGAVLFPAGVILQTMMHGPLPSALAVGGASLVILALATSAVGFARGPATP